MLLWCTEREVVGGKQRCDNPNRSGDIGAATKDCALTAAT